MGTTALGGHGGRTRLRRAGAGLVLAAATVVLAAPATAVAEPAASTAHLGFAPLAPITGLKPGADFTTTFAVKNTGAGPATEVELEYGGSQGLDFGTKFSNCWYETIPAQDEGPASTDAHCSIQETLQPGVVYAPSAPLPMKTLDSALYERFTVGAMADSPAWAPVEPGAPEPVLHLLPLAADPGGTYGADFATADLTVDSSADFALTGAQLTGEAGRTVTASVVFANKGPGWVQNDAGKPIASFEVNVPPGTTVVAKPNFCLKDGTARYNCFTEDNWVGAHTTFPYPFKLRIDKVVPDATGAVAFVKGQHRSGTLPFDHDPANNTAKIVLNAGASSGTGGASGSGGSSGTPGAPGPGGQMAATGAGDTLLYAGLSAAALAVGGAFALSAAARRR